MDRMILVVHLVGLGLSLGAAAVKVSLLLGSRGDAARTAAYLRVAPTVTRLLVTGLLLLTGSGIGWLARGRPFTPWLITKLGLVAIVWVLGPFIDRRAEPEFVRLAPSGTSGTSPELSRARRRYVALELVATGLLGLITVLGVLV